MHDDRDQEIKELFKGDNSQPKAPDNEWNQISQRLGKDKSTRPSWAWTMAPTLIAACAVFVLAILPHNNGKLDPQEREELARYLFEDSFPHEEDQTSFKRFDSL